MQPQVLFLESLPNYSKIDWDLMRCALYSGLSVYNLKILNQAGKRLVCIQINIQYVSKIYRVEISSSTISYKIKTKSLLLIYLFLAATTA